MASPRQVEDSQSGAATPPARPTLAFRSLLRFSRWPVLIRNSGSRASICPHGCRSPSWHVASRLSLGCRGLLESRGGPSAWRLKSLGHAGQASASLPPGPPRGVGGCRSAQRSLPLWFTQGPFHNHVTRKSPGQGAAAVEVHQDHEGNRGRPAQSLLLGAPGLPHGLPSLRSTYGS